MHRYLSVNRFMPETVVKKEDTYFQRKYILLFLIFIAFVGLCIPAGIALNNTSDNRQLFRECEPYLWRWLVAALCSPLCIVVFAALLYVCGFAPYSEEVLVIVYTVLWSFSGAALIISYVQQFVTSAPHEIDRCRDQINLTAQPHLSDMGLTLGIFMPLAAIGFVCLRSACVN
jgi:hypothetical protein